MKNSMQGLEYICALLKKLYFETNNPNSGRIVAPQYIFRGITQRHFTSSEVIKEFLENSNNNNEEFWQDYAQRHNLDNDSKANLNIDDEQWIDIEKDYYDIIRKEFNADLEQLIEEEKRGKKNPTQILQDITANPKYALLKPQYVRSGAAIRLNNIGKRTRQDYISYITNLISELKTRYPREYEGYTDLDILADIQHKGGASCLVDFSTNFLISLWFATQDYSPDNTDLGYLFCYDVNRDAIEGDSLTILGPHKRELSIEELINETVKSTRFSGIQFNKFWLWKPDNLNSRITRQDSIFVFGIEKFKASDPSVIVLPIPPTWKGPIQTVLKDFFGLYGETIFADANGLSSTNNKFLPIKPQSQYFYEDRIFPEDKYKDIDFHLFQKGMAALLKSQYEIALEFFCSFEGTNAKSIKARRFTDEEPMTINQEIILVELQYSKGLCLSHLGQMVGAADSFDKALSQCLTLTKSFEPGFIWPPIRNNKEKDSSLVDKYIFNKLLKILEDYIGVLYDLHRFDAALKALDDSKKTLESIDFQNISKTRDLISTAKNEIRILKLLYSDISDSNERHDSSVDDKNEDTIVEEFKSPEPFINFLNKYFILIQKVIQDPTCIDSQPKIEDFTEPLITEINGCIESQEVSSNSQLFTEWNLTDIDDALDSCKKRDDNAINPKVWDTLASWTAKVKDCIYQTEGRKRSEIY